MPLTPDAPALEDEDITVIVLTPQTYRCSECRLVVILPGRAS